MRSLTDKVIVITGASRGIGAGIARLFAAEKPKLVLCARSRKDLISVAKSINLPKKDVLIIAADVSKPMGMRKIVSVAFKKFGRVDVFINNAGVVTHKTINDFTEKDYDTTFNTNLKSVFYCFKFLLPLYEKQGGGQIINISSMAGRQGVPGLAAYSASKAALNTLSEAVAGEVRNKNIKISVLAPGSTDTALLNKMKKGPNSPSHAAKKLTVQEVAEATLFLAKQNTNAWTSMADIRPLLVNK